MSSTESGTEAQLRRRATTRVSTGLGDGLAALAHGVAYLGLALAGAWALLATPALMLLAVLVPSSAFDARRIGNPVLVHVPFPLGNIGPVTIRGDHLWVVLLLGLLLCWWLGLRSVTGRAPWPVGALLLVAPLVVPVAVLASPAALPGEHAGMLLLGLLMLPHSLLGTRWVAGRARTLAGAWDGVPVPVPYRPVPAAAGERRAGLGRLWPRAPWRARWLLTDPASWRDLMWSVLCGGAVLALVALPGRVAHSMTGKFALAVGGSLGLLALLVLPWAGPVLLPVFNRFNRWLLGPTRQAELALRVRHLAETRSDTIDTGAAEMRRIERDLHDGAQARLVAMGMALSVAESLFDSSPEAARALLGEAREASGKALAELRDLVRGIHPPVLADRGLADAVHALALDLPLRVHFSSELAGRPPEPVESAAYFTVSELLANVTKHADADQVWIEISHNGDTLRIVVTDDGRGGADPAAGSGLRGLDRRLAAFDGILAVSSPPGGPTLVNLEIPCALSSPKTSSC